MQAIQGRKAVSSALVPDKLDTLGRKNVPIELCAEKGKWTVSV